MNLTFWGAARQVTGSMYLLETKGGYRLLVDCGLDYEQQRHFHSDPERNFPFEPGSIHALLLTHAHIDHSGNIPNLVRQGFRGPVFCTPPTADLIRYLLMDSANIQAGDYRKARKGRTKKAPLPLYNQRDVMLAMEQLITVNLHQTFSINDELSFTFYEAGHLLGAASIRIEYKEEGKNSFIGFTGDIGRSNSMLVRDPEQMPALDYLVTESTYGARLHKEMDEAEAVMLRHIKETCVDINGKLIIPAFSVGRTQAIMFALNRLDKRGLLPPVKVFVDSPLAMRTTPYYEKYISTLNQDARDFFAKHGDLFSFDRLKFVENVSDENDLQYCNEPHVIISAAGMVEGGRIQKHIQNHIQNPFSTILIAGFCAKGTLGDRLLSGQRTIRIQNRDFNVYAKMASTDVFSSHAGREQLLSNTIAYDSGSLQKIFLTHGDSEAMDSFSELLRSQGLNKVHTPEKGEKFTI